ncbi:hypothetical protein D3C72_1527080 [compost metagenome]
MKKMMLLLPLLFSVNAFAVENPCANGCTYSQIQDYNKANFKSSEQMIQEADEMEAEMYRKWVKEHEEAQARADALPKYVYKPMGQKDNCVSRFYKKADDIIGDTSILYIDVREIEGGKCTFEIKLMAEEMCNYFDSFSSLATPGWSMAEWCRYTAEKNAAMAPFSGVRATDDVKRQIKAKLLPVEQKHHENITRLFEKEQSKIKQLGEKNG